MLNFVVNAKTREIMGRNCQDGGSILEKDGKGSLLMQDFLKPSNAALLNTPLCEINLSVRAICVLKKIGAETVGDAWNIRKQEVLSRKNAGIVTLKEIRLKIADFVLTGTTIAPEYYPRSEKGREIVKLLPVMQDSSIARKVCCSRELVRQLRVKTGIPAPSKYQVCKPDFEDNMSQLIKMAKEGQTAPQIGKKLNLLSSQVRYYAKTNGIELTKGKVGGPGPRVLDTSLLAHHLSEGRTCKSAATALCISYGTSLRWARKLGLKTNEKKLKKSLAKEQRSKMPDTQIRNKRRIN